MSDLAPFLRCDSEHHTVVFDLRRGFAELAWIGTIIPASQNIAALCDARLRGCHQCQPGAPEPLSILPQSGWGYDGTPAVVLSRHGKLLPSRFVLSNAVQTGTNIHFTHVDPSVAATIDTKWSMLPSGVIQTEVKIGNTGREPFELISLASLALPLPPWARYAIRYFGRWAAEMQTQRQEISRTGLNATSFGGRPGFGGGNWIRVESADAGEDHGQAIAAHLAWSGDHMLQIEQNADGGSMLLMSARLEQCEISLAPGESFCAPPGLLAVGGKGISTTRQAFHRHAIAEIDAGQPPSGPRKVHLNTWEALGFDMDLQKLCDLADAAAPLGIERFVLDDGWFTGRRNDTSSLGDWTADPGLFPQGLKQLTDHVAQRGMDFGLWVEPEMVSPDSDLYRAHPEWCLNVPMQPRPGQRNQLVLDLTQADVSKYLFEQLHSLLRENNIAYLKWDHNRELFPLVGKGYAQVISLYALLDRIKAAHPHVEIETCASGGGRVDFAMLGRCTRFWASDNNDALDRVKINSGWFDFLPLRTTGSHVGPSPNPITGRCTSMDFRAKLAIFGHMGVEANPATMSKEERDNLAGHIAIYKQWRNVLHTGAMSVAGCDDPNVYSWFVWSENRGLALVAQTQHAQNFEVPPVRLTGLLPQSRYKVTLVEPWPERAARHLANPDLWRDGIVLCGLVLGESGLALPLTLPETAWLISVELVP